MLKQICMNIIVVDDEFSALNVFLSNIVDSPDINFTMFHKNPCGAVEYVKKNSVDAAFLDINIEEINGIELAKNIIAVNNKIKIVFISGFAQNETKIKNELGDNLIGFCPKPYSKSLLDEFFRTIKQRISSVKEIYFKTFGGFDMLLDDAVVPFRSTKSKELLALLVHKSGLMLTMDAVISYLWSEKSVELAKRLYRDAVYRLRLVLNENGLNFVTFGRGCITLEKIENIHCDMWDFIFNEDDLNYNYEYLPNYDWSIEMQSKLDLILEKRIDKH